MMSIEVKDIVIGDKIRIRGEWHTVTKCTNVMGDMFHVITRDGKLYSYMGYDYVMVMPEFKVEDHLELIYLTKP